MTKYKVGDVLKIKPLKIINGTEADNLNRGGGISLYIDAETIMEHEPAPEPIKKRFIVCKDGIVVLDVATDYRGADYIGDFEVTITGNDFTVEKVTQ